MEQTVITSLPLDPAPTFESDVTIELPGSRTPSVLRFEFFHKRRAELAALDSEYLAADGDPARADGDLIERIAKRWIVGPVDAEGRPVAFNRAALDRLLDAYPAAIGAIYTRYQRELREARLKN